MVEKTFFRKRFLEISLFLTLFPSDLRQNCPAHSPRTVEQYCGPRPNRSENSETDYEVMIEKKLKTEKRFFGMTKDLFGKTSEKKCLENRVVHVCKVSAQSFGQFSRSYSEVYILDMVVI